MEEIGIIAIIEIYSNNSDFMPYISPKSASEITGFHMKNEPTTRHFSLH